MLKKAVFLDRDGTLNEDPGYLSDPAQLKLLPGVGPALARLKAAGFLLVVVSNQSGVARGLIRPEALSEIHKKLGELLAPAGVAIDHFELCLHHPDEDCACRKPKPKLILDASAKLGVDVHRSYMVGDKYSDLGAGKNAGCKASIVVRTGDGRATEMKLGPNSGEFIVDSLPAAVDLILKTEDF